MYKIIISIILIFSLFILSCLKDMSPISNNSEKIIPLKLKNEWEYENLNSGVIFRVIVENTSSINNQKYFILNNSEFIFGYEKLFYKDKNLYSLNRENSEILLFKEKSINQHHVFEGRVLFEEEEVIEVPAGTFKCFKILHRMRAGFNQYTTTIWFSYGIGPIMKISKHQYQQETISEDKYVLKSYIIN